jgi:uncharacterized protein
MKLNLSDDSRSFIISAYQNGGFTINGQLFSGSCLVWPSQPPKQWEVNDISSLDNSSMTALLTENIEALIIGTGKNLVFPDALYPEAFHKSKIGIEIMDTPAACRTYNILVSEGRNVMAALMAI